MKVMKLSVWALLSIGMIACGGSESSTEENHETTNTEEVNNEEASGWRTIDQDTYFDVDVPSHMEAETGLNAEASLQYAYVEQVGDEVKEHYMIVLMETKEEIESYEMDMEFDALSYGDLSVNQLGEGLDTYEVLTKDPQVETVNGIDCVKYEMEGSMGDVNVYYQLGVFEGEKAFYQVLTWTLTEQKSQFKSDMEQIINSFKEK